MKQYSDPLQQVDRTYVLWRGRKLVYFAGCDYLRLASHPAVLEAAKTCLEKYGLNVAASRKTTGNHQLYGALESAVQKFFKSPAVVISSTGYFTNIIAAQALCGTIDRAYIDEQAHGSLREAAGILRCEVIPFKHRDPADLKRRIVRSASPSRSALLSDGIFAHNGAVAPLREYRSILGPSGFLWVDDAHAAGSFGDGRGTVGTLGLSRRRLLQTITFSKAFGTYGGAILCEKNVAQTILERSAAVGGNTPMPLPIACATIKSLSLCNQALRQKLRKNLLLFWGLLAVPPPRQLTPIIAIVPAKAEPVRRKLLAAGIYPSLIRYPGGPREGYFRFALSSEHSPAQVANLAKVLADFASTSAFL